MVPVLYVVVANQTERRVDRPPVGVRLSLREDDRALEATSKLEVEILRVGPHCSSDFPKKATTVDHVQGYQK